MERRSDNDRQAGRETRRAAVRQVQAFLGPYRRTRRREADTAVLLRQAGTPESLIGPTDGSAADSRSGAVE
jgi:hypothetical protein